MPDGSAANRDEIDRGLEALTRAELLKLKHFAAWRVRGLGRAASGRTWEDLLGEAELSLLQGAMNNGGGRLWTKKVDLMKLLEGAMRSISSHWKRDFDEQEADFESEIPKCAEKDGPSFPLDNAASSVPSQEREVGARQHLTLLLTRCQNDPVAIKVLEGLSIGLIAAEVVRAYRLTQSEYRQASSRIRRRVREFEQERRRGL